MNESIDQYSPAMQAALMEYVRPQRPWVGLRRKARWEVDGLPPLQSFDRELNVLRALLRKPTRNLRICRHSTLDKNRWLAAERVARIALRAGDSPAAVSAMLIETHATFAAADYFFTPYCAKEIVESEMNTPRKCVIHPGGGKWPRIIGVCS